MKYFWITLGLIALVVYYFIKSIEMYIAFWGCMIIANLINNDTPRST